MLEHKPPLSSPSRRPSLLEALSLLRTTVLRKMTSVALPNTNGIEKCNHTVCLGGRAMLVCIPSVYPPLCFKNHHRLFLFSYSCDCQCTCLIQLHLHAMEEFSPHQYQTRPLARALHKTPWVKTLLFVPSVFYTISLCQKTFYFFLPKMLSRSLSMVHRIDLGKKIMSHPNFLSLTELDPNTSLIVFFK